MMCGGSISTLEKRCGWGRSSSRNCHVGVFSLCDGSLNCKSDPSPGAVIRDKAFAIYSRKGVFTSLHLYLLEYRAMLIHPPLNQGILIVQTNTTTLDNVLKTLLPKNCCEFIECPKLIDATHGPKGFLVFHAMNMASGGAK